MSLVVLVITVCFDAGQQMHQKLLSIILSISSYPSVSAHVLGAQKNRLIEAVLLSTQNICFGLEIRKNDYAPLTCRL